MSSCNVSAASTYEKYSGIAQLVASQVGRSISGTGGQAYAILLMGQNTWVSRVTDLVDKIDKNEAKPIDYAQVALSSAQILASVGVLAGVANPWT